MLDLRLRGHWYKAHHRHYVVSLSKTLYALLSTGSTKENRKMSWHYWKIVEWDIKHQHKHKGSTYPKATCMDIYCRTKVDDIKELQKLRERPKGVSSVGLALGKKISQTEDVDSVCTCRHIELK